MMTYSGLDSGVRLDMSSDVGTKRDKSLLNSVYNIKSLIGSQRT